MQTLLFKALLVDVCVLSQIKAGQDICLYSDLYGCVLVNSDQMHFRFKMEAHVVHYVSNRRRGCPLVENGLRFFFCIQDTTQSFELIHVSFSLCSSCLCSSSSSRPVEISCATCSATWCPLLPSHLLSLSSNKDFTTHLSQCLGATLKEEKKKRNEQEERKDVTRSECREVQSH